MAQQNKRGALIVFEGLDRSGKSTQCDLLMQRLSDDAKGSSAVLMKFPDRQSPTGKMIDSYLKSKTSGVNPQMMHLLFSANRWEQFEAIQQYLMSGQHVVMDRYVYSGIVYSHAQGLDWTWCTQTERGLVAPDLVVYLNMKPNTSNQREGFGQERYETDEIQSKVEKGFSSFFQNPKWTVLDASKPVHELHDTITTLVIKTMSDPTVTLSPLAYI